MKGSIIILFALAITVASVEVVSVTESNYEETVMEAEYSFLMFYHKKDMSSRKLLPKFKRMSKNYPRVNFVTLEASKEKDLAENYLEFDYPSFILYISGIKIKSSEHESIIKLKKWLTNKLSNKIETITDQSQIAKNDLEVYVSGKDDSHIVNVLKGYKIKYQETRVYKISSSFASNLAAKFNLKIRPENCLFIRRKHDEYTSVYSGELIGPAIEVWLLGKEFPDYSYFSDQTLKWFEVQNMPLMIFFHDPSKVDEEWIVTFKETSIGNKGVVISILADVTKDKVKDFMKKEGFKSSPSLVIIEWDKPNRRYLCRKRLNVLHKKLINNCAVKFFSKSLPRFYKSEETEMTKTENNLRYITGTDFGAEVYDNMKDHQIVYFYDNATTGPIEEMKKFASKIASIGSITATIFNIDENEHKTTVHIKSGTLIYYSPTSDSSEFSKANFEVSDILNFLEDNTPESLFSRIYSVFNEGKDL